MLGLKSIHVSEKVPWKTWSRLLNQKCYYADYFQITDCIKYYQFYNLLYCCFRYSHHDNLCITVMGIYTETQRSSVWQPFVTEDVEGCLFDSLHYPDSKAYGAYLGPGGPRWAPCWPHEPCYQGTYSDDKIIMTAIPFCCILLRWKNCSNMEN